MPPQVSSEAAADTAFHRRVCLLAGHRRLLEAWDDLAQQVLALYTVTDVPGLMSRLYGYVEDTGDRHRPIVAALRGGDLEGLAKYISNHILENPDSSSKTCTSHHATRRIRSSFQDPRQDPPTAATRQREDTSEEENSAAIGNMDSAPSRTSAHAASATATVLVVCSGTRHLRLRRRQRPRPPLPPHRRRPPRRRRCRPRSHLRRRPPARAPPARRPN